jgi:DNA-binding response OmpR family regulator
MKILIIEDDSKIIESIRFVFQVGWPEVKIISTRHGEEGLEMVENESPQLVILDLGLPDIEGFEVLRQIRLFSNIPVVILTVSGEEENIIKGLELGADEYITKPFKPLELIARVKKALKSHLVTKSGAEISLDYGNLRIFVSEQKVQIDNKTIKLTSTESLILKYLASNAGMAVPNEALAEHIWGNTYPDCNKAIRVYIRQLRKKLEKDADNPQLIITRPGIGYMLIKPG